MTNFEYELKICPENRDLLNRDIRQVENGEKYGTINAVIIEGLIREVEDTLFRVAHDDRVGTTIFADYNAAENLAKRTTPPHTTQVTLEYREDGWYVVNIQRAVVRKKRYDVTLSDKAVASIRRGWSEHQR
ncbi:MAG: hypothetical protein VB115_16595 [Christensenellaceae bacterium]|nr:hypothetical protein [Christensenellaceae bacterium]